MIEIEDTRYLTWEDTHQSRARLRVDVYLGVDLCEEVNRRARLVEMPVAVYMREIVRQFVNTHPAWEKPQEA